MMKIHSPLTRALAFGVIALQASITCFADGSSTSPRSAEIQLLTSVMTDASMKLSQADLQKQITQAVSIYDKTAPEEGREDRLVGALVDINAMTAEQAQSFRNTADASLRDQVSVNPKASDQEIVNAAIQETLSHESGAQFSSTVCTVAAFGSIGVFGIGSLVAADLLGAVKGTCTGQQVGENDYLDYTGPIYPDGSPQNPYITVTSCTHPLENTGTVVLIGGLVAGLVGAFASVAFCK